MQRVQPGTRYDRGSSGGGAAQTPVVEFSQQVIALIDSSKFGKEDLTPFARLDSISHLFTDANLSPEWIDRLKRSGIKFTICEEETVSPL